MSQGMVSSQDARLVFRNARRALKRQKVPLSKAILSQSYLRFEVPLDTVNNNYTFSILVNQQNAGVAQTVTEQRLNLQDSFYISHMGVFLKMNKTASGNTTYKDYIMSFPSAIFDGSWNVYQMYNYYNGFLKLTINNRVLCPAWDVMKHLYVPVTQYPEWFGAPIPGSAYNMLDQFDGSQNGFYPVEPNWVLIGSKNNVLTLNLPHSFGTAIQSSDISAVVVVRGVLAQNSTSVH